MWHAYGNANGYAHIHSDSDCHGNRYIHSDCDCDCNGHIHADSDTNSDIYSNRYRHGDGYSYSNGKRIAATFTDGTASSDTGTATVKLCGLFISLGTRERTSRVLGYGRRASVKHAISFTKSPPIR
jgi:hypothetical protein